MDRTTFSTDGTGNQGGEIAAWSVTENATPVAPGAPAAAAGGATVTVDADSESDLLVGDEYTLTDAEYGTVSGRITNANLGPLGVSITGDNPISRLSAVRTVPPGGAQFGGSLFKEQSYIYSPSGLFTGKNDDIYSLTNSPSFVARFDSEMNYLGSLGGNGSGDNQYSFHPSYSQGIYDFEADEIYIADTNNNRIKVIDPVTLLFKRQFSVTGPSGITFYRDEIITRSGTNLVRYSKSGTYLGVFAASATLNPVGKIFTDGVYLLTSEGSYAYSYDSSGTFIARSPQNFGSSVNPASYYSNGVMYVTRGSGDFARTRDYWMLTVPEMKVIGVIGSPRVLSGGFGQPSALAVGQNGFLYSYFEANPLVSNNPIEFINGPTPQPPLSDLFQNYIDSLNAGLTLDYQATVDPYIAAPGWTDSVWTKLNELCVAYNVEIAMIDDVLTVRDVGSASLNVEDMTPVSKQVSLDGASRYVDIQYSNARAGVGVMYDAATDGSGRTFEVAVREDKTETILTPNFPVALQQPQRTTNINFAPGQYYLIGSDNLPIQLNQFEAYGGSVTVSLTPGVQGSIDLHLIGPAIEIPGVPGPYRLAISDGSNTYPAFSVLGTGVLVNPQTVRMSTGADWEIVTNDVSGAALANPFIGTRAQAWDRGRWAAVDAAGPNMSLSFSISYEDSNGFGLTTGSLFTAYNAVWRVTSASFGISSVSVTAVNHTTFADVQPLIDGSTIAEFFDTWGSNKIKDFRIRPLTPLVD